VQDAANVVTEAIDPDAKVIFGAITDETLKKGQIRVTVIATGFPEGKMRTSLFGSSSRTVGFEDEEPIKSDKSKDKEAKRDEKGDTKKKNDDEWASLPSFLRKS